MKPTLWSPVPARPLWSVPQCFNLRKTPASIRTGPGGRPAQRRTGKPQRRPMLASSSP